MRCLEYESVASVGYVGGICSESCFSSETSSVVVCVLDRQMIVFQHRWNDERVIAS